MLEYTNKHKNSASWRTLLIIVMIVATLALMTFIGAFLDYWMGTSVITFVMFGTAFFIAYTLYKKAVVEYRYIYSEDVFTVDRLVGGMEKTIFVCDKKYIKDVLMYDEYAVKYGNIRSYHLAFNKKKECIALVYANNDIEKAVLIHADKAFFDGLLKGIDKGI